MHGPSKNGPSKLVKQLYGVSSRRGGTEWLDECPNYLGNSSHHQNYALLARYREDDQGDALELTTITIQSSYLRNVVRQVLGNYPGENIDAEDMRFKTPFAPFFHQWPTLSSAYEKAKREETGLADQVAALMNVLKDGMGAAIRDAQNVAKNGNITFPFLWTLFPPGCPVVGTFQDQQHLFLVNGAQYLESESSVFAIDLLFLDYDGERYGWRKTSVTISNYMGTNRISSLPAVPLHFLEDTWDVLQSLYARGAAAVEAVRESPVCKSYEGLVRLHKVSDIEETSASVEGRIMVDPKAHRRLARQYAPTVSTEPHQLEFLLVRDSYTKAAKSRQPYGYVSALENFHRHPVLSMGPIKWKSIAAPNPASSKNDPRSLENHRWTESLLGIHPSAFCCSTVRGYCLTHKSWAEFEVNNITATSWNRAAFSSLVIPPARKRLLEALVRQHQTRQAEFDDVVRGKGKGLVMLLTGPPGTGKTLTAESIADHLQLPLYAVSASELGDTAQEIEHYSAQVMRLAAGWSAVLLLDEADAFFEQRAETAEARERNKRVASFLRTLEYYQGILILTTNRSVNFDKAFHSRIHLTLPFKPLDRKSREDIWTNFLWGSNGTGTSGTTTPATTITTTPPRTTPTAASSPSGDMSGGVMASDISRFAVEELNGRQIKNVVMMAKLLAKDERDDGKVTAEHVREVLEVMKGEEGEGG